MSDTFIHTRHQLHRAAQASTAVSPLPLERAKDDRQSTRSLIGGATGALS
jgi:hypothetical protein